MAAYKGDKKDTWYAKFRHRNWKGELKSVTKRGFRTKRDALQWEREYKAKMAAVGDTEMTFGEFTKVYLDDAEPRLKDSTQQTKDNIIETKILPYFGDKILCDIRPADIIKWQNTFLRQGKYSPSYLKTIHNQLSSIFNHAVRYYELPSNPARTAGNMGGPAEKEMLFWTKEEYLKFSQVMMDHPTAYYAFQILYWCGLREGELLALTRNDINLDQSTLSVTKT